MEAIRDTLLHRSRRTHKRDELRQVEPAKEIGGTVLVIFDPSVKLCSNKDLICVGGVARFRTPAEEDGSYQSLFGAWGCLRFRPWDPEPVGETVSAQLRREMHPLPIVHSSYSGSGT